MSSPTLRGLQAFEAVGRCGTVTAAARELGVSPGAISQQVRNVEQCLGLTLLERKGRHLNLTSWGRLYFLEIAKGFQQFAYAGQVLERARSQNSIVLSALSSVVNKWIGRKIFDWQALYPDASVRLQGQEEEPRLGFDQVDFRIAYGGRAAAYEHVTKLFTDWVVPACAPTLLSDRSLNGPSDILNFPLLNVEWEAVYQQPPQWIDWAKAINVHSSKRLSSLSFTLSSSAIDAAVNGRGFVLAQISMISEELTSGTLVVPFDIRLKLPESYFLAWDRTALEKPFGKRFHKWLLDVAKKQNAVSAPSV